MARLSDKYGEENLRSVRASRVDYYEQHDVDAWVDQLGSLGVQGKNSTFLNLAGVAGPIKGRKTAMHDVNYKAPVAAAKACRSLGVGSHPNMYNITSHIIGPLPTRRSLHTVIHFSDER
jgi:hypothetical protein